MEAVLRGTAGLLAGIAERQAERKRAIRRVAIPDGVLIRVLKFLLHIAGFGAFIWSMFQVHSVAGGLAIMVSCFAFSWLIGRREEVPAETPRDPGLRR